MAFKQTLIRRMFNITNLSNQTLRNCRISSATFAAVSAAPDPGDNTILRRFLNRPEILRSRSDNILVKLKEMDLARSRINLDALAPPLESVVAHAKGVLTIEHAKKILQVSQIEKVKYFIKKSEKSYVVYDEFVEMCVEQCLNRDQGLLVAKALDDSGSVIVLGNVVFLKPQQVVKAIHGLLSMNMPMTYDPPVKELEEMEQWKAAIDAKAKNMVQRELWGGLAYLMIQTAGFMRLTFWELSWDVMEPICFYITSMYFMGGYAFFLRTAKEPSFEGFYQSRFSSKQKKLMKRQGFDIEKYKELRKACYPHQEEWPSESSPVGEGAKKSFT